ncbi:MAG: hypothetical protein HKN76_08980, partial [Saprospiraceae bacterium]|nr:hypothetical protein [Saprospiraceae bacterium]
MFRSIPERFFLTFLILYLFVSCHKNDAFIPVYDVDPAFEPFVSAFIREAASHGVPLEIKNLIMHYEDDLDHTLCGKCNSLAGGNTGQKEVRVRRGNGCWENNQELETLIFHELGHCILGRLHLSDTLPNGDPKSLMIESNLSVYAPCRYVFGQAEDCNNVHKRAYYINELFDLGTA